LSSNEHRWRGAGDVLGVVLVEAAFLPFRLLAPSPPLSRVLSSSSASVSSSTPLPLPCCPSRHPMSLLDLRLLRLLCLRQADQPMAKSFNASSSPLRPSSPASLSPWSPDLVGLLPPPTPSPQPRHPRDTNKIDAFMPPPLLLLLLLLLEKSLKSPEPFVNVVFGTSDGQPGAAVIFSASHANISGEEAMRTPKIPPSGTRGPNKAGSSRKKLESEQVRKNPNRNEINASERSINEHNSTQKKKEIKQRGKKDQPNDFLIHFKNCKITLSC
jgi:hypothetical protein